MNIRTMMISFVAVFVIAACGSGGGDSDVPATDDDKVWFVARAEEDDADVLMMFNSDSRSHLFYLPRAPHDGRWHLVLDTSLPSPADIHPPGKEVELEPTITYHVKAYSMVVMISKW